MTAAGDDRGVPADLRFEEGLERLEALVTRLESGDLPLEEALADFERGLTLVRALNERLTAAERRIEILVRGEDGGVRLQTAGDEEP